MDVVRVIKDKDYVVVKNTIFRNKSISLKAKGMYALLMSLSDEWDFSVAGIISICKEGKESVYSSLKELESYGYCQKKKVRDTFGKILKTEYVFFEEPMNKEIEPHTEKPYTGNQDTENPLTDNPPQYNTNSNKLSIEENQVDFDKLIQYFNLVFKKNTRVISKDAKANIKQRLKDGYLKDDVKKVIDNASNDVYHIDNNYKYITLEFLSRPKIFERYASQQHQKPYTVKKEQGHTNH